jgi:hypothetical protein
MEDGRWQMADEGRRKDGHGPTRTNTDGQGLIEKVMGLMGRMGWMIRTRVRGERRLRVGGLMVDSRGQMDDGKWQMADEGRRKDGHGLTRTNTDGQGLIEKVMGLMGRMGWMIRTRVRGERKLRVGGLMVDSRGQMDDGKWPIRGGGELLPGAQHESGAALRADRHKHYRAGGHHLLHRHQGRWGWALLLPRGGEVPVRGSRARVGERTAAAAGVVESSRLLGPRWGAEGAQWAGRVAVGEGARGWPFGGANLGWS